MFVSRRAYTDTQTELVTLRERARLLGEQNRALLTTQDWLRTRLTQLEKERAALVFNYTGVQLPVPEIQKAPDATAHPYNQIPDFLDVGDKKAEELGISWNPDGSLAYR